MTAPTDATPALSAEQRDRYARQIVLSGVGAEGQGRLLGSSALVVGAGGLGSAAAIYLAAAGVGVIGIADGDRVERSNLQRQILHTVRDLGRPKTRSAVRALKALNPDVNVVAYAQALARENALDIVAGFDVAIGCCDNFPARYLLSDACVLLHKPLVEASVLGWEGQITVFAPNHGCYRCLHPVPAPPGAVPGPAEVGILGGVAGHLGTLQAVEAIKILLGVGDVLVNRLLLFDALAGEVHTVRWDRDPRCAVCGDNPTVTTLIDYEAFCRGRDRESEPWAS